MSKVWNALVAECLVAERLVAERPGASIITGSKTNTPEHCKLLIFLFRATIALPHQRKHYTTITTPPQYWKVLKFLVKSKVLEF